MFTQYPGENEYNSYLTKYGGNSNAFTAHTSTNYYFELSASSTAKSPASSANSSKTSLPIPKASAPLYGALDRFAQFFIHPLFLEDTLDRELRAVDSENKKNLQSDQWRMFQLNRELSSEKHPYHNFATGSYQTLHDEPLSKGIKIRDAFINFYKEHYSANRMKLVVLGRESLDELQGWVEEFFTAVPDQNLPQLRWDGIPVYGESDLGIEVFVKPVMQKRQLDLHFPYPDEENLWQSKPGRYIAHLVGHEGPGSLLAYLKGKGWVNDLSAGAAPLCPGTGHFSCSLTLTEDGLKHYREIVKVFFQYIALLKDTPPQEWVVDEMAKLSEVEFKFRQKSPASRTTSGLSGVMQQPLPREQILSGQYLITKFDPKAISRGLAELRPDNFRYNVVSKEYPGDWPLKEKWYGTEYKVEKIPADFMRELESTVSAPTSSRPTELYLPGKNEFVPQRLDVEKKEVETPATVPKLIRNHENSRTWFKKDDQFWVPKANVHVCLRSPITHVTPLASILTYMYKELIDDSLNEYSYDAEIAGLRYGLSPHTSGLDIQVSGYNDKMSVLLEKVLLGMRDLEVKEDRFEIVKESLLRGLRNFEYTEPFRQSSTYTRWLMAERSWAQFELTEELESVTAADVRAFFPQILRQMHIEILVHGNMHKEDALHITELVERTLKPRRLPASQWPTKRSMLLPPGSDYRWEHTLKNPDNINHCIEYIVMVGQNQDRELRARLLLMSQMLDEPCFNTLRTQEQLGYIVGSGMMVMNTVQGFRILIQSEKDCAFLETRIDNFLIKFDKELEEMSEGDFEKHKIGLINKRMEKLKNLSEESGRLWHHVASEAFDFDLGTFAFITFKHVLPATNKITQYPTTSTTSNHSPNLTSKPSTAPTSTPLPKPAPRHPSTSSPKAAPPPRTTT
jgi:insulysin